MPSGNVTQQLRSRFWFDDRSSPGMTALYLERYLNFGMTRAELQSGRPIIGIAQTGSDLAPCNRHHIELARRVKDGIREVGGVALEFPVHTPVSVRPQPWTVTWPIWGWSKSSTDIRLMASC